MPHRKLIWVFSSPRSGSSWIAKILDSNPDTLYLHEPDIEDRGLDLLPYWIPPEELERYSEAARAYVRRILGTKSIRAIGSFPQFSKSYRNSAYEIARRIHILAAKLVSLSGLRAGWSVPAFLGAEPKTVIVKSVSALGRVKVLLAGTPEITPVLILRNPIACISSRLAGIEKGLMASQPTLELLALTLSARRFGFDRSALERGSQVERLAIEWLIANSEAYDAVKSHGGHVLIYDEFAEDPLEHARSLLNALNMGWSTQTLLFLRKGRSRGGYYSVSRKPSCRSRPRKDPDSTNLIEAIVSRGEVGRLFFAKVPT